MPNLSTHNCATRTEKQYHCICVIIIKLPWTKLEHTIKGLSFNHLGEIVKVLLLLARGRVRTEEWVAITGTFEFIIYKEGKEIADHAAA